MKTAFLIGLLAMGAHTGNHEVNLTSVMMPVTVTQQGKHVTAFKHDYIYSLTANDTRASTPPTIKRYIANPA